VRVRGLKRVLKNKEWEEKKVAPRAGAWVETVLVRSRYLSGMSHPVRVRGLKPGALLSVLVSASVAPRAGAWVETQPSLTGSDPSCVAPRAGAWVETFIMSIPPYFPVVAPRAGAWVETAVAAGIAQALTRRTPCGCVG